MARLNETKNDPATEVARAKRREYMRKWREENRERHNELARQSYRKNWPIVRQAVREQRMQRLFNMRHQDYDDMLAAQNGVCAICGCVPKYHKHAVDHDHDTGEVRGILCSMCNMRLAWMDEHRDSVLRYLKIKEAA